jgi:hypothetical protein
VYVEGGCLFPFPLEKGWQEMVKTIRRSYFGVFAVAAFMALLCVLALSGVAWAAVGPLTVTKTEPNSGATGVARTANVKAYFNHDMRASTVTSSTFKIRKEGTTTWLGATRSVNNTVSPTSTNGGSQSVATLNPNADFASGTTYQVRIVGGSSGVKDVNGGALSTTKSWTFTTTTGVVATPPETTIGSGPTGTVSSDSAAFTFSSSKAGSTFQCSLDGTAFAACTSPKSYSSLNQGNHTFQVRAIDSAGSVDATPASRTWTVDTIGPNASITDGPPSASGSRSASFTFTGAEPGGSYECKIDGAGSTGTFSACTSPKSFTVDTDGSYTFSVRASDALGNFGTPATHTWTVDTTIVEPPPVPPVTVTPNPLDLRADGLCLPESGNLTVTNNGPGEVTFADVSITGPDAARFSSGSQSYLAQNGPFTVQDGNHFFDEVTFVPEGGISRKYEATLTYKDGTGATIGDLVGLTATTSCIVVG